MFDNKGVKKFSNKRSWNNEKSLSKHFQWLKEEISENAKVTWNEETVSLQTFMKNMQIR